MNLSHKTFISNIPSNIIKPNSHKINFGKLKLWLKNCDPEIKKVASTQGILSMQQDGVVKILNGITSFEEVMGAVDLNEE